ncbi:MAG: hypothetical protein IJ642_07495 [Oscillospiraceae bacterium]|nr:hypothetical protein [Oscillospiraceae bacterium]
MKKFLLLFIIFALLCFTSCTYTAEENTEAQFQYQQEILLFIVDTVFPYQQYITVISETGEQYCFSYSGSDSMPNYWHSSDKNWYDKLIVLMTEENKTEHSLEENDLNLILNQISQFQNYRTKEIEIIS